MKDVRKTMLNRSYLIFIIFGIISLTVFIRVFSLKVFEKERWAKEEKRIFKKQKVNPERGNIYDCNGKLLLVTIRQYDLFWDSKTGYINKIFKKEEADTTKKTFIKKIAGFFKLLFKDDNKNEREKNRKEFYLKLDSVANFLSKHNGTTKAKEFKLLDNALNKKNYKRLPIAQKISYSEYKEFYNTLPIFKKPKNTGGLFDEQTNTRAYTYGEIAKVTLGNYRERFEKNTKSLKKEKKILSSGLDGYYNKELSGIVGLRLMQLRNGRYSPANDEYIIKPTPSYDIISTIDANIQDIAHNSLSRQLDSNQASHGCVIVMEVKTGHVKAIVNLKLEKDGKYHEGFVENSVNYAISDNSDVGSIFKLASVIAVLEIGKLNENSLVKQGKIKYGQEWISDSHISEGIITLRDAFKKSSNVGISQAVIKSVGNINDENLSNVSNQKQQQFIDILYKLTLNDLMNLDVVGEKKPFIKSIYTKEYFSKENKRKSTWSRLVSLPYISIGYEIRITPLKILSLYNAVANNGVMVKPMFVKEIKLGNTVIETKKTTIINPKICSEKTLKTVKSFLEDVTKKGGTAAGLFDSIYRIAGKTGTNQMKQENASDYGNKDSVKNINYKSSFVGYFPADNPKYSCIVIVYEPKRKGYYGGVVAAPVFKDIADKIYASDPELKKYLKKSRTNVNNQNIANNGYSEDIDNLCKQFNLPIPLNSGKQYGSFVCNSGKSVFKPIIISKDIVPNVVGMGVKDAIYLLEKQGFKTTVVGNGRVVSQSLEAGTKINKTRKQTVLITLSSIF